MHSSRRSRNAAPSAVSSSSRLAVADEGIASRRTWFAKGRADSANGLSVMFSRGVLLFIYLLLRGVCKEGVSRLGASNSRKYHDDDTGHLCSVNAGGPGKTLDGRAILVLGGKELQVLTRTAKVATSQRRESKEKTSGLMFGLEGRGGHHGYSYVVTNNCRMRTDASPRRALRVTKDTPGRGRLTSMATSGFGILNFKWGGGKKEVVRKKNKSRFNPLVVAL